MLYVFSHGENRQMSLETFEVTAHDSMILSHHKHIRNNDLLQRFTEIKTKIEFSNAKHVNSKLSGAPCRLLGVES